MLRQCRDESSGQGWGTAVAAQGIQSSLLPVLALLALRWDESRKEIVVLMRDPALSPEAMLKSPVMCVRHTNRQVFPNDPERMR